MCRWGQVVIIEVPTAQAGVPFCTGAIWNSCCKQDFGSWCDASGHVAFKTCWVSYSTSTLILARVGLRMPA